MVLEQEPTLSLEPLFKLSLTRRLGTLPTTIEAQVRTLALPEEALGEALLNFAGGGGFEEVVVVNWIRKKRRIALGNITGSNVRLTNLTTLPLLSSLNQHR